MRFQIANAAKNRICNKVLFIKYLLIYLEENNLKNHLYII